MGDTMINVERIKMMNCQKIEINLKDSRGIEPDVPWYENQFYAFGERLKRAVEQQKEKQAHG